MQALIEGRAYPPLSSAERPARLAVEDGAARLEIADAPSVHAEIAALAIEAPVGRGPRQIVFPDGTLFWTEDVAAIAAIESHLGIRRLSAYEAFSPRLILWVALSFLGAWAIWRFALPAAIWVAVALTPDALRDAVDAGTISALDRLEAEESALDDERKAQVRETFDTLLAAADLPPDDYTLLFRDLPGMGPNALALPGGTIIITDALVLEFPNPSVIAGVLAHEIGHVEDDHGLRQVYRSLGLYVLITMIAGDTGPLLEDLLLEGGLLLSLTYSRAFEREADQFGMNLAAEAGFDPEGLLAFFEALPDAGETEAGWTSTHPASGERIEAIRAWLADR